MRILVPVDGSEISLRAVRHAARLSKDRPNTEIHLLNVQLPIHGSATSFVPKSAIRDYHLEEGRKALDPAEALLRADGVDFESHIARGAPGEMINAYAREKSCDAIVMGTRGLGRAMAALLGSTANAVLHDAKVPVTLVK
jgi:nucleotide-binding universal stress UspA family protein